MHTLISAEELLPRIDDPSLRIFDCRFSLQNPAAGLHAYERGHLPGAMFADLNQDLSSAPVEGLSGRHPLPHRDEWIDKVCNWGLEPETLVVLYDDVGGAGAARMWWMLQWIGHEKAAVLDGGLQAWQAAGGALVTTLPGAWQRSEDVYSARKSGARVLRTEEVNPDQQLLIDARELPRFRGEVEPLDPVAGHIPQAICRPYTANLDESGKFRSPEELRARFADVENSFLQPVCYCGSGVTACHNILAIAHAGLPLPTLYAGSWSEWVNDPARPVATGD